MNSIENPSELFSFIIYLTLVRCFFIHIITHDNTWTCLFYLYNRFIWTCSFGTSWSLCARALSLAICFSLLSTFDRILEVCIYFSFIIIFKSSTVELYESTSFWFGIRLVLATRCSICEFGDLQYSRGQLEKKLIQNAETRNEGFWKSTGSKPASFWGGCGSFRFLS